MTTHEQRMKQNPDEENEVHDLDSFEDGQPNIITPVLRLPADVARVIVGELIGIVRRAHEDRQATTPDADGITRAQTFEEGDVYMLARPTDGYFADRYLMDFYNVKDRGICSRMHYHTGIRFVRMMTGPDTTIRISSLRPFEWGNIPSVHDVQMECFEDALPDTPNGEHVTRYNAVVPPCSWVDMQVPRGTSHQFNAVGPHAVIDSVHPEESIETFREAMSGFKMMAQTLFLADELPDSETCLSTAAEPRS